VRSRVFFYIGRSKAALKTVIKNQRMLKGEPFRGRIRQLSVFAVLTKKLCALRLLKSECGRHAMARDMRFLVFLAHCGLLMP
jgi:hypothetical protein